jgi:hypothetical protein
MSFFTTLPGAEVAHLGWQPARNDNQSHGKISNEKQGEKHGHQQIK